MTTRETLHEGGENGPAFIEGSPEESALIEMLSPDADPHMPPKKQLSASQIATLSAWVKEGAAWDAAALREPPSTPRAVPLVALPASYHPVFALALSPDSTRLAVGYGNHLVIYDAVADKPVVLARATFHLDPVQSISWRPDGKQLATGAFRRVTILDAATLEPAREILDGLAGRISALCFLPDGNRLAIADGGLAENGIVRIADAATGGIITAWPAHGDAVYALAASRDGNLLATAGGDKLVKIWELSAQRESARFEGHVAQVLALDFNANATQLVSGGADQQLKIWDVQTREQITALGSHSSAINAVSWASSSVALFVVTDAGGLLRYTDFKAHSGAQSSESAKEKRLESADNALYCVAATPDGHRVFAGSHDGRLFVWDKEGKLVRRIDVAEEKTTAAR